MDKLVLTVFKTLGITIILMALITFSNVLYAFYTVTANVSSTAILLQNEIARHNGLPTEEVCSLFANRLVKDVLTVNNFFIGVESNFGSDTTNVTLPGYATTYSSFGNDLMMVDSTGIGTVYPCIEPEVEEDYGETINLGIVLKYNLRGMIGEGALKNFTLGRGTDMYYLEFRYKVPCLHFNG